MPALPLFTFSCLLMTYLVWSGSAFLVFLSMPWSLYVGLSTIAVCGLLSLRPAIPYRFRYDLFCFGCLLTWFAYWRTVYTMDAPVFYFFPLYFVLFSVCLTYFLINKRAMLDAEQMQLMGILSRLVLFKTPVLVGAVLGSLLIPGHYLIYPICMTLMMIRYSFSVCLEDPS